MPPLNPTNDPPVDSIERDFLDALTRLQIGQPTARALKVKHKKGLLKITISSVATEAARSRTLIGMDRCRYPRVRAMILREKSGEPSEPRTFTETTKKLRARIVELQVQLKQYQHEAGAHFIARHEAEKLLQRANNQIAKLTKKLDEAKKVVVLTPGAPKSLPPLLLIRGIPGSGKSTRAIAYKGQGYVHLETDMYFRRDGEYIFDKDKLPDAHAWCLEQTRQALAQGNRVVVANVFANLDDIRPYTLLSTPYEVIETTWRGTSGHDVPPRTSRAIRKKWVPTSLLLEQLQTGSNQASNVIDISQRKDL